MKKHILSLALTAMFSITVYGQELRRTEPILANAPGFEVNEAVEIQTVPGRYHILDLRKVDLGKGTNMGKLKIQPVSGNHTFKNKLAADENLHEFIFVSKDSAQQKLVLLLPKSMILAGGYTERLPTVVRRLGAVTTDAHGITKVYDGNTPVETIPATRIKE